MDYSSLGNAEGREDPPSKDFGSSGRTEEDAMLYLSVALQDYHIHTFESPCGKDPAWTPDSIAKRAGELGMRTVVIADHYHESRPGFKAPPFYCGVDEAVYRRNLDAVGRIDTEVDLVVGCEIDMLSPGNFTVSDDFARALPVRLVSSAHYHLEGIGLPGFEGFSEHRIASYILERMFAAVEWPYTHILAHPLSAAGEIIPGFENVLDEISDEEFAELLSFAQSKNVAMEIRASIFEGSARLKEHQMRFYSIARRTGCKIAPASDAHSSEAFGSTFRLVTWVRELGFSAADVVDMEWIARNS